MNKSTTMMKINSTNNLIRIAMLKRRRLALSSISKVNENVALIKAIK